MDKDRNESFNSKNSHWITQEEIIPEIMNFSRIKKVSKEELNLYQGDEDLRNSKESPFSTRTGLLNQSLRRNALLAERNTELTKGNGELKARVEELERERAILREGVGQVLMEENARLREVNTGLTEKASDLMFQVSGLETKAAQAKALVESYATQLASRNQDIQKLKVAISRLQTDYDGEIGANAQLRLQLDLLQKEKQSLEASIQQLQAQRTTFMGRESQDRRDPRGYWRVLGIDPALAAQLPPEKLDYLINQAYRVYANIWHPEKGGDDERMKQVNNARDFLLNPSNRRTYGR